MKIFLVTFLLYLVAMPAAFSQHINITGKVTDTGNEPLAGATVFEAGTTNGTTTDADGNYSIHVKSENANLKFTYIGFEEQHIKINGRSVINVILKEETSTLDEVVVVGFGAQKRVNLTGSIATVTLDEKITSRALTNLTTALSGQLPDLAVSQNSGMAGKDNVSILIRGMGTVNNANPLIVVDGMPDVNMNRLNLNDVESVTVLKDASSAAIYGSRAANGVILITTKSGKGQDKARFEFSSNLTFSNPTNQYEYMADYPRALTLHQVAQSPGTLRQNYNFKDGTIDQWMALGMIDPIKYPNTDWWDIIIRTGMMQNYNLSASGSNDISNFFVSVGVMDEEGLQINNDYKRYNARFNFDYYTDYETKLKLFHTADDS